MLASAAATAAAAARQSSDETRKELSTLEKLIERVNDVRRRFHDTSWRITGFDAGDRRHANWNWFQILHYHFLGETRRSFDDDLLFIVRKRRVAGVWIEKYDTTVEVYRRHSPSIPTPEDEEVDFEETVYLNLILHYIEFSATICICSRASPRDIQVVRRLSMKLFGTPHRPHLSGTRQSDHSKGAGDSSSAEITYPDLYFPVEDYESVFSSFYLRDSESICVELVARDPDTSTPLTVLFQGSVRYEALQQAVASRQAGSGGSGVANGFNQAFGRRIFASRAANTTQAWNGGERADVIRMKGPLGKGLAEVAVSQVKSMSRPTTPSLYSEEEESVLGSHFAARRPSDPYASRVPYTGSGSQQTRASTSHFPGPATPATAYERGGGMAAGGTLRRCRSDIGLPTDDEIDEVVACRVQDDANDTSGYATSSGSWGFRGFNQAWHWFREKRRENCIALRPQLMCIKLPWHSIIHDLLEERTPSVLTL